MVNVSIIIPIYNPDKEILDKIIYSIKKQKFQGKVEILKIDKKIGLANSINYGINKSKYPIVITLHQDCIPESERWLEKLVEPLEKKEVICTVSDVELPKSLWDGFDIISKVLSVKEQKLLTPLMDEKGCAYKKDVLLEAGLFDGKNFRTAGEDFDMYFKLAKKGKIEYPHTKVIHNHNYNWKSRLRKEYQLSNSFGALVRIYGRKMSGWYFGAVKSLPIIGYPLFFKGLNLKKIGFVGALLSIPLMLFVNILYCLGFWKGFLTGRQTV